MNILFLHRNFPGQFRHIVAELAKNPNNTIFFITQNDNFEIPGVNKVVYEIKQDVSKDYDEYLRFSEEAILHGQAAAKAASDLKNTGFKPDVIYGHNWGPAMFMKDIFPTVPLICYFEWFYNAQGADFDFGKKEISDIEDRAKVRCKNAYILTDLCSCNAGVSPSNWQKSQFPKEFHDKIKVIHDGVDTEICKPDDNAKFLIKDANIELTVQDEVITYATRGMEDYRGFPQFMIAAETLLKKRPNLQIVIAGEDKVFYGRHLTDTTYKQLFLDKLDLDLSRVHFVGTLPYEEYVKLLQISSAHVYLTYPFVLSWSVLEAMSVGCCVVASNTQPVQEVIKNTYNGLLFNFFNINQLIERVEYVLDNQDNMKSIRKNARKTVLNDYALKNLLPKQIEFIKHFTHKHF